jgi:hypothetical protein
VPTAEAITVRIAELDAEQTKLKEQMPGTESQMDHRSRAATTKNTVAAVRR